MICMRTNGKDVLRTHSQQRSRPYDALNDAGQRRRHSQGIALITSMIILGVLALLGVSTMRATNTELQIATNLEGSSRSFHAAEAGITAARTAVFVDSDRLGFRGNRMEIDFTAMTPNPLSDLGSDAPTVTAVVSGDPRGKCERMDSASSDDLIGCAAFDMVSTHAPATAMQARDAATTTLRLGVSRQVIAVD
ncbi:MAG: PilX N-terminal domain-containing pilus assembly protein [Thiohalocapsa sp.]